jgi:hypothetical protein
MARIGSRKWTAAQIEHLMVLIDAGSTDANAAVVLKRSVTMVRAKARNLGKPFCSHRTSQKNTTVSPDFCG